MPASHSNIAPSLVFTHALCACQPCAVAVRAEARAADAPRLQQQRQPIAVKSADDAARRFVTLEYNFNIY